MKHILFLLLLVFASTRSYSQLSFSEMVLVYNMNLDQFENFALKKGYSYNSIDDDERRFGLTYIKGNSYDTKFITLYTKYHYDGKAVTCQTSKDNEILSFKDQLKQNNFKLNDTENFEGSIKKVYSNSRWIIRLYSGKDDDGHIYYESTLVKRQ